MISAARLNSASRPSSRSRRRPSLYRTSALFLRTMGMQSLDELPVLPDLSSDEGAEKLEQAISELRGRGEQMELTDTEQKPTGE